MIAGCAAGSAARDAHVAAARRPEVADARRDRAETDAAARRTCRATSGCTCHSMFAVGWPGSLFANAPSCDGGIVSGPVRNRTYSSAIAARPTRLLRALVQRARVPDLVHAADLQVVVEVLADAGQVVDDRDAVLPRAARRGRRPRAAGSAASRSRPRRASTSRRAAQARAVAPCAKRDHAGRARRRRALDDHALDERVGQHASSSAGCSTGRRNALVALQRTPRRWFIWK